MAGQQPEVLVCEGCIYRLQEIARREQLQVMEVWDCYEPIPRLGKVQPWQWCLTVMHPFLGAATILGTKAVAQALQHRFLVFVLGAPQQAAAGAEPWQHLFLRVERQQPAAAGNGTTTGSSGPSAPNAKPAVLKLRFARTWQAAVFVDAKPHKRDRVRWQQAMRFSGLLLEQLLWHIHKVHGCKPLFEVTGANCIWFADALFSELRQCAAVANIPN